MIGTVLAGKYRIEAQLFVDKLGTAYRGRTVSGGASLLVLVLDAAIQPTKEQLDHILSISKQIRDLNHPSLVPTIDWLRVDGQVALVSPRNDAIAFEEFCKGGVGLAETVDLASQIGEAVQVARDAGISHKDLSSHTVLVSIPAEGGQVPRIFFWGYEALLPPYSVGKKDDKFWGTPEFMAPELCSGKGWNPQSDVYSMGILLFQLVTGKPPFISTNYNTTMKRQIYEKPLPLNLLKRGIPHIAEFEKIVFEALQKMVAKRPESTRHLAGLLNDFRHSFLPEAASTPLQVVNWPAVSFTGDSAVPVAAQPETAGTMTFRGLGDAAEKAAAEARIEGASTDATLRFQSSSSEEQTATFVPSAVAPVPSAPAPVPAPAPVAETRTIAMEIPVAVASAKAESKPDPKSDTSRSKKDKKKDDRKSDPVASAPSMAGLSPDAKRRIEEESKQLEETGDDWFVDGHDMPKPVVDVPLPSDEKKPATSSKEWRLWALIALVSLAIVAVLIWVVSPGADDSAKKAPAAAAPKAQALTKVPMAQTPATPDAKEKAAPAEAKQKEEPKAQQPDAAAAKKAADEAAAKALKDAEEAKKAEEAAKKAAADAAAAEAAKKASADAEAARLAAEQAAKKAAADAEAARLAAEEAAKKNPAAAEAAKKAAEEAAKKAAADAEAAKKAADEAAKKAAADAAAAEAAKKAQEEAAQKAAAEAAKKAAADAEAAKKAAEAAKAKEEAAAKKAAADAEAAKKAAEAKAKEDAAKKANPTDDAAKKAAEAAKAKEEAAKKAAAEAKAKEEAAKKAAAEAKAKEDAAKKEETAGGDANEQAKKFKGMGIKALKKGNCPLAIRYFETAKKYAPEDTTIDKFIEKCKDGGGE